MPRLLSLFDGTGVLSRVFRQGGWEVSSLDIDGRFGATIVQSILDWDYSQEPPCDVIVAGCPCESYSIANTTGKRNMIFADKLVAKTWEIIQHFSELHPTGSMLYFINSDSSNWSLKNEVFTGSKLSINLLASVTTPLAPTDCQGV